jgi:hypothetical protein
MVFGQLHVSTRKSVNQRRKEREYGRLHPGKYHRIKSRSEIKKGKDKEKRRLYNMMARLHGRPTI